LVIVIAVQRLVSVFVALGKFSVTPGTFEHHACCVVQSFGVYPQMPAATAVEQPNNRNSSASFFIP